MIVRYQNFDSNPHNFLMEKEEYDAIIDSIDLHIDAMLIEGKTIEEINEGLGDIFSNLFSSLGGGFKQTLYQYAAQWLLERLGLPTNNFLTEWAVQVVTKINFLEITNYFGKGSCKYWTDAITEGTEYFITYKLGTMLTDYLVGNEEENRHGLANTFLRTVFNALAGGFNKTKFSQDLQKMIEGTICGEGGPSLGDIFKGKSMSPDDKNAIKKGIHQEIKEDPSTVGEVKSSGLGSFISGILN